MKLTVYALAFYIALPISIAAQAPDSLNIAVNDLSGKGIEQFSASIISDRLRSELIATGLFRVMERNEMATILMEQGFQQTGACEASCLVEVGQLLGVERMVAGSIGKIDSLYTLSVRMINVATGQIMFSVDEYFNGDIKGVLSVATGNAASKLAAGTKGEISMASLVGKTGDLYIASNPEGATIEIDGKTVTGQTPITLEAFPAGEHRIVGRKDIYSGETTIVISPGDLVKVNLTLKKDHGTLKLFTTPVAVDVLVDGKNIGTTPIKIEDLTTGEHRIRLSKLSFLTQERMVSINNNEQTNLDITLKPAGYISVKADQERAHILVNGADIGIGAVHKIEVPIGTVIFEVKLPVFETFSDTILIAKGEHVERTITLSRPQVYLDSIKAVDRARHKREQWKRRVLFGSLAAAAWGGGAYTNSLVHQYLDNQSEILADTRAGTTAWDRYNTEGKKATDTKFNRNILFGLGGLFSVAFVISIPL
jgi:hypothetical protein